jgi:HD-GYP domain-containing protein (c-di-GMP phosphodiesterase class II)/HD-like signal output (HDOD) protein
VIYALSDALDLVGADTFYHGKRVAVMAAECGRRLGLPKKDRLLIFHAGLLRDCGVSSSATHQNLLREMHWIQADEHCQRGHELLAAVPLLDGVAPIVRHHHTPWREMAKRGVDKRAALLGNLLFIADRANTLVVPHLGPDLLLYRDSIIQTLARQRDQLFAPMLLDAFLKVARSDAFWLMLEPRHIQSYLGAMLREFPPQPIDFSGLVEMSGLFARVADAKGAYMVGHSPAVGRLAQRLGELKSLPEATCAKLHLAGLLHDIGKLRVPDEVMNKTGPLSRAERAIMNRHCFETYQILRRIAGLEEVAVWAAYHHESMLEYGLPFGEATRAVPLESHIVAVAEAFQAMAQDRPHRAGLPPDQIVAILRQKVAAGELDSSVVELVATHVGACWQLATGREAGVSTPDPATMAALRPQPAPPAPVREISPAEEERLIDAVLAGGVKIPPLPSVLLELQALQKNEDAGAREYAGLISRDVGLSGAVFRVARSPVFALRAKVDTLDKAVSVLGIKHTEAIVRSEALRQSMQDPHYTQILERLWKRLGGIADLCALIVKRAGVSGISLDQAYTVGMFHDCGVAMLCKRYPAYAQGLMDGDSDADILRLDRELQTSHAVLGQSVAKNWQLPVEVVACIRFHHDPAARGLPDSTLRLIGVLQFAIHLYNVQSGEDDGEWSRWQARVGEILGRGAEDLTALGEEVLASSTP